MKYWHEIRMKRQVHKCLTEGDGEGNQQQPNSPASYERMRIIRPSITGLRGIHTLGFNVRFNTVWSFLLQFNRSHDPTNSDRALNVNFVNQVKKWPIPPGSAH